MLLFLCHRHPEKRIPHGITTATTCDRGPGHAEASCAGKRCFPDSHVFSLLRVPRIRGGLTAVFIDAGNGARNDFALLKQPDTVGENGHELRARNIDLLRDRYRLMLPTACHRTTRRIGWCLDLIRPLDFLEDERNRLLRLVPAARHRTVGSSLILVVDGLPARLGQAPGNRIRPRRKRRRLERAVMIDLDLRYFALRVLEP